MSKRILAILSAVILPRVGITSADQSDVKQTRVDKFVVAKQDLTKADSKVTLKTPSVVELKMTANTKDFPESFITGHLR